MPDAARPVYAVTGAGGYVGGAIARFLESQGCTTLRVSRSTGFSLETSPPSTMFSDHGVNVLVHCAYDFSAASWPAIRRINVDGSLRLFDAATRAGVQRLVFISSLSAHEGCMSWYGRGKWQVEQAVLAHGGHVIRPGTVFGPRPGGMMGALAAHIAKARWIPAIQHPRALRLTHEDDLAALVAELAVDGPSGSDVPWLAAGGRVWKLEELITEMARRAGRSVRVLPVPWRLVWAGLKTLETVGMNPSFRSDSVLSLAHPVSAEDIGRLRVSARTRFRDY